MKELILTDNSAAIIDDNDFEELSKYNWTRNKSGYVYRMRTKEERNDPNFPKTILLHRQIMNVLKESRKIIIDHKDHDKLNNQRTNLRLCNQSLNGINKRTFNKETGYKGVQPAFKTRFRATITKDKVYYRLGIFKTAEEAAQAYNDKAIELYGEFAFLNEIRKPSVELSNQNFYNPIKTH